MGKKLLNADLPGVHISLKPLQTKKEKPVNNKTMHWATIWGNAVSVAENRPETYSKNITLRYPIYSHFAGDAVRLTFDNYCGTEPITIAKTQL